MGRVFVKYSFDITRLRGGGGGGGESRAVYQRCEIFIHTPTKSGIIVNQTKPFKNNSCYFQPCHILVSNDNIKAASFLFKYESGLRHCHLGVVWFGWRMPMLQILFEGLDSKLFEAILREMKTEPEG